MEHREIVRMTRAHLESRFPKTCGVCARRYDTLRDYLRDTEVLGSAIPYDAEAGDWRPADPLGVVAYSLCACGTTLALTSDGMPLAQLWALLACLRQEARRRGTPPRLVLDLLREEIAAEVLAAPDAARR